MKLFQRRSTLKIFISKNEDYEPIHLGGVFHAIVTSLKKPSFFHRLIGKHKEHYHNICWEIAALDNKIALYSNLPVAYKDRFLDQLFVSLPYVETDEAADTLKREYRLADKLLVYTLTFKKKPIEKTSETNPQPIEHKQNIVNFSSLLYGVMQNFARNSKDITIQYIFTKQYFQIKIIPLNFDDPGLISNITHAFSQAFNEYDFKMIKSKQNYTATLNRTMTGYKNKIDSLDEYLKFIVLPKKEARSLDFEWAMYTKKNYNFGEKTIFDLWIGTSTYREKLMRFGVNHVDRFKHMYVIGKSGTGKSTLLEKFIKQDFKSEYGLSVLDPHGELIEDIMPLLTKKQKQRLVHFDGIESQVGLNLFLLAKPNNIHNLASSYISIMLALFGHSWGPRLEHILRNTLLTLLAYSHQVTPQSLEGVIAMLTDATYRKKIYMGITDQRLKDFWVNEFNNLDPKQKNEATGPILNKVGQLLSYDFMHKMLTDQKSTFNASDIMDNSKIFLANLSKGVLGEDAMRLIGMLLIVQYQISAFGRKKGEGNQLASHFLYIDEFQNFITENFCSMLSECRKYKLGFILANQYIDQLPEELRAAVFGNVGNLISFNVSNTDADILAKEFGQGLRADDFVSIPRFNIYSKIYWGNSSVVVSGKS